MYVYVKMYQILVFKTCMYLHEKNEHIQEKILVETIDCNLLRHRKEIPRPNENSAIILYERITSASLNH